MKSKMKPLLILGAIPIALVGIYWVFALGMGLLPSGYRQAEAQWTASQRNIARALSMPPNAVTAKADLGRTSAKPSATLSANRSGETFGRCWVSANQACQASPGGGRTGAVVIDPNLVDALNQYADGHFYRNNLANPGYISGPITASPGSIEAERTIRVKLAEPMRRGAECLDGKLGGKGKDGEASWMFALRDSDNTTTLLAQATRTPPHSAFKDLIHLPPGAVPLFPPVTQDQHDGFASTKLAALGQAWLYAVAHEPGFDAAAGLRRLYAFRRYLLQSLYPRWGRWGSDYLNYLPLLAARCDTLSSATCRALTGELLRLESEVNDPASPVKIAFRQHQAQVMHEQLMDKLELTIGGDQINNNTFSFMLDGKPERLWFRANAGIVRHQIDLLALAMAEGKPERVQAAKDSLMRAVRVSNLNPDFWTRKLMECQRGDPGDQARAQDSEYLLPALELALGRYRRDHGRLPSRVADLWPAYLPESARRRVLEGQTWLIQDHPRHPILWHVISSSPFSTRYSGAILF